MNSTLSKLRLLMITLAVSALMTGCAVVSVAGAAVSVATSVAKTAVSVGATVIETGADVVGAGVRAAVKPKPDSPAPADTEAKTRP